MDTDASRCGERGRKKVAKSTPSPAIIEILFRKMSLFLSRVPKVKKRPFPHTAGKKTRKREQRSKVLKKPSFCQKKSKKPPPSEKTDSGRERI